ncbi:MAG TPA: NahK/ErcS family hybrid sensor histidine kinase/response regulator [Dongiaceae bacterium]|jgi:PAS domain S-box-containing protein|nr:NahK/ErcS family hybrid sensor histidine kinase/response regulator [Dongiaceae bacterium]
MAADSALPDETTELRNKVAKLTEINRALMQRVEHGLDLHGNAYHLFQAAILLDRMVRDRTRELEQALEAVATSNRELNEAAVVSMTTQNRLQDAIDSISEGFAIFDPEDRLILFNRRFTDFWPGLGTDIRTGLTFQDLIRIAFERGCIAAPDGQSADAWIVDRLRQRESTRRHGSDRWVYAQSSGRWVQVNDRRSIEGGLASIYTDITDVKDAERQERERALAERSLHLQATLESMSIGVAVFDKDQRLVTANRQYGELLSLPATLLTPGASLRSFQRFNDLREVPELGTASPIITTHGGPPAEVSVNGRWFSIKSDPMPDGGFVVSYAEITDRRQAEEALHDSEARIRLFANAMPTMMCYIDDQERYQFVNRAYRAAFAREGGKLVGRKMRAVLGESEYEFRRSYIERALAGSTSVFDVTLPSADGEPRFGLATYVPHRNSAGRVVGFFTLIQDITERRRTQHMLEMAKEDLERRVYERTASLQELNETLVREVEERRRIARELRSAKVEAELANASKTQFLADASHDLLQPLNTARLFIASIQGRKLPRRTADYVEKVDRALVNIEDILNILLDISKLESGRVNVQLGPATLSNLMQSLRDEVAPLAERAGLTLQVVPTSLSVRTDVRLLRRLLQNLLTNACRYTPNGKVLFGVRRRGKFAEIQVADTGIGIPKDKFDEIFAEFRRLADLAGGSKGYGLGLSIVRRISRLLDHPVEVRSQVGKGSVFSVLVPLAETVGPQRAPHHPRAPRHTTIDGVRVLVIDNEAQVLEGMTSLLDTWRCRVIAASDAEGALSELDRTGEQPELLLVDYHLDHGRVGTEAINAIRARVKAGIPAAIITADHNPAIREDVRKVAGVSLLLKPIKPARLRALIASVRE